MGEGPRSGSASTPADSLHLRCPDCGAVAPLRGRASCGGCGRVFEAVEGVWDLRPGAPGAVKLNEDRVHEDPGPPTWRRLLLHKRHWIQWADADWLPTIVGPATRAFLEIGGGLCYASALAKARAPAACVVATDVSPRYLRRHAVRVGAIFGSPADVYAAADAESLPFDDGQFDAVYSQVVLYRVLDPVRALREVSRVLAPGGRYLGIERASPWAAPWRGREARAMRARGARAGIAERPIRFGEWRGIAAAAGVDATLTPVPGRRVRSPLVRRLGNAARPIYVSLSFTR